MESVIDVNYGYIFCPSRDGRLRAETLELTGHVAFRKKITLKALCCHMMCGHIGSFQSLLLKYQRSNAISNEDRTNQLLVSK